MTDLLPVPAVRPSPPARRTRPPVHARVMAYAELCDTPPDLRFGAGAGTWCPMCRGLLAAGPTGWACPACAAEWDYRGLHGRWITTVADVELSTGWRLAGLTAVAFAPVVALAVSVARSWHRLCRPPASRGGDQ
jgi:hypothetical protein